MNGDGFADLVVGAFRSNTAYLYLGGATGLGTTPITLTGSGSSHFGGSVASAGDVNGDGYSDLVVGAYETGTAYLYLGGAAGLGTTPTTLTGPSGSRSFGYSVASAGDVNGDGFADLVVGALNSSTAYLYLGSAAGLTTPPTTLTGPLSSNFGYSVASAGDVNGDSFADLVVGALASNTVYLYLGSAAGLTTAPTTLTGPAGSNFFGSSVASAGDVNGDGFADLAVGTVDISDSNTAYLYLGSAAGLAMTPTTLTRSGGRRGEGVSVASAGDVNGDGFADLAVGSRGANTAYLYLGSAIGLATPPMSLSAPGGSSEFAFSVANVGDANGDSFADLVVGSPSSNTAYLYLGSAAGLATIPTTLTGPSNSGFGVSLASVVNGVKCMRSARMYLPSDARCWRFVEGAEGVYRSDSCPGRSWVAVSTSS